jgi:sugar/nucleoside kinase (ribokinase family)
MALLESATDLGFLRIAAFVSGEASEALSSGMLHKADLLALNLDEARAFAGVGGLDVLPEELVRLSLSRLLELNDSLLVVITAGKSGSWSWDGASLAHAPALKVIASSTAGAGDSHLAGIVTALAKGVGLHEANAFGALIGAMKVGSPHTINPDINPGSVLSAAARLGVRIPDQLQTSLARIQKLGATVVEQ